MEHPNFNPKKERRYRNKKATMILYQKTAQIFSNRLYGETLDSLYKKKDCHHLTKSNKKI